jgi:hypothetical protein
LPSLRRKRRDSRRSRTECLQCQIHRDSLRGASGSQRAHRVRRQPQSEQQQQQPEQQTRQQQPPHRSGRGHQTTEQSESPPSLARSGPRTRGGHTQPQPTPRQRRAVAEELTERESNRLSTPSYPEDNEQRLSESISVTSVTCRGRRFGS